MFIHEDQNPPLAMFVKYFFDANTIQTSYQTMFLAVCIDSSVDDLAIL